MKCPHCGSDNTSAAETRFSSDYPFWMVLTVVFAILVLLLALFLLLQLHPVILILVIVAIVTRFLGGKSEKRKKEKKEYVCLDCKKRFKSSRSAM